MPRIWFFASRSLVNVWQINVRWKDVNEYWEGEKKRCNFIYSRFLVEFRLYVLAFNFFFASTSCYCSASDCAHKFSYRTKVTNDTHSHTPTGRGCWCLRFKFRASINERLFFSIQNCRNQTFRIFFSSTLVLCSLFSLNCPCIHHWIPCPTNPSKEWIFVFRIKFMIIHFLAWHSSLERSTCSEDLSVPHDNNRRIDFGHLIIETCKKTSTWQMTPTHTPFNPLKSFFPNFFPVCECFLLQIELTLSRYGNAWTVKVAIENSFRISIPCVLCCLTWCLHKFKFILNSFHNAIYRWVLFSDTLSLIRCTHETRK